MSETSQGPGYWQASDGRWYPPETHPAYRAPDRPAPASLTPGHAAPMAQWPDIRGSAALSMTRPRKRRGAVVAVVVVVVAVVAGVGAYLATRSGGTTLAAESPTQVLRGALLAGSSEGSMTVVVTVTRAGGPPSSESQQSTTQTGSQQFALGTSAYQNRCVPGACYVEGNVGGLEKGFGMTPLRAAAASGKWLALPATSTTARVRGQYTAVLSDTTLSSFVSNFTFPAGLANLGAGTDAGQRVVKLSGHEPIAGSSAQSNVLILVAAGRPHTLVRITTTATIRGSTETEDAVFSRWGSTPPTVAPPSSVPFARYLPSGG